MQPKIKNATFATRCNPYQKLRDNSRNKPLLSFKAKVVFLFAFFIAAITFELSNIGCLLGHTGGVSPRILSHHSAQYIRVNHSDMLDNIRVI